MIEIEEKYLPDKIEKRCKWEREFIIYQWYSERNIEGSEKYKIIFDLDKLSWKFVKIRKSNRGIGVAEKQITYLTKEDLDIEKLKEYPFVMKRRSIKGNIFLDKFIYSNELCEYLLEIEYEDQIHELPEISGVKIGKNVTADERYLNKNMTIAFSDEAARELQTMLKLFEI